MTSRRIRRSADQWQSIVRDQEYSGLKAPAYCESSGISYQSFMKWRQRFRTDNSTTDNPGTAFVELTQTPMPGTTELTQCELNTTGSSTLIELSLGAGIELRISRPG